MTRPRRTGKELNMGEHRDFLETERTPGWEVFKDRVAKLAKSLEQDLATIPTEGKTADQIGTEYTRISAELEGVKRMIGVADDIKKEPDEDL